MGRLIALLALFCVAALAQLIPPGGNATTVNGGAIPPNQPCLGSSAGSQIVIGTCGSGTGNPGAYTSVASSPTPTFTASSNTVNSWLITMTANVTSSTLASSAAGQFYNFKICQNSTGGYTFAWPTGFSAAAAPSPYPSACTKQSFYFDGTNANPVGVATVDLGPTVYVLVSAPSSAPPSGSIYCWPDSSGLTNRCENSAGVYFQLEAELTTGNIRCAGGVASPDTACTTLLVSGIVDGRAPVTITTGTTANLGGTYNSGYTLNQEGTAATGVTYTLPATAAGKQYCVANSGTTSVVNTGVLTIYPPASSYVILNGVVNTVGSGGTHGVASGGAAGDSACFVAIDSTHWQVYVGQGTWTEN
jgi:hypothetical protein